MKKKSEESPQEVFDRIINKFKKKVEKEAIKALESKLNPADVKLAKKYKKLYNKPFIIQPFSIASIRKAYAETGLTPSQGIYYINSSGTVLHRAYVDDEREKACPLGALAISRNNSLLDEDGENWREGMVGQLLDVPAAFVNGFIQGFDNSEVPFKGVSPWVIQGYENGRIILDQMVADKEIIPEQGNLLEEAPVKKPIDFNLKELFKTSVAKNTTTEENTFNESTSEDEYIEEEEDHYSSIKELLKIESIKEKSLIDLNKPVKEFFIESLNRLPDLDLLYLIFTRFGDKRYTVRIIKKEIENNTKLGQQFVLEVLTIAANVLSDETQRLPFRYGNAIEDREPLPKYQTTEESANELSNDDD